MNGPKVYRNGFVWEISVYILLLPSGRILFCCFDVAERFTGAMSSYLWPHSCEIETAITASARDVVDIKRLMDDC